MGTEHQLVLNMAGMAVQRGLYRSEQLLGVGESILQRMADQVGVAQPEQMFGSRIEEGKARLIIQQDDCGGNVFQ
jgi:hypothetical protein